MHFSVVALSECIIGKSKAQVEQFGAASVLNWATRVKGYFVQKSQNRSHIQLNGHRNVH